ncbi:hypothetical protein lbkm_3495 [Lachnospiraceae bacterium KM106-2]|nr:hypothetical protein lbkm_3495 [Lachnospiraceae bacterium KM106-2]
MKNKMIYIKFAAGLIISMIIGGFCGAFISGNDHSLKSIGVGIDQSIQKNAGKYEVIIGVLMIVITVTLLAIRHYRFRNMTEEIEGQFESFELYCKMIMAINSIHMVFQFILYGIFINRVDETNMTWIIGWFVAMTIFIMVVEVTTISTIKKYNPTKQVHPLDLKFSSKWLDACDEAERYVIYVASYHTYQIMNYTIRGLAVILMLCNLIGNIGTLPFLVVGTLWLVQVISYYAWCNYISKQKINY